jgi:uncharacterized membrane protein (DUF2068 family)
MDWSLLGCGRSGHLTYAPDEPAIREQLSLPAGAERAWRCLRCGAFVVGEPALAGPASQAPPVRRDRELRSALILRIFAVERFIRAVVAAVLAFVVWRLEYSRGLVEQAFDREIPVLRGLFRQFGYNIDNSKLVGLIRHALTLSPNTIKLVALALAVYAVIEVCEGIGLWLLRRWGEYFAMVATSLGLPYEIYDLSSKVTVLRVLAFVINLALVLYLVISKRLLGVRGGKRAYEARLRSESIMDTAIGAAAAGEEAAQPADAAAGAGQPVAPGAGDGTGVAPAAEDAGPAADQDAPEAGGEHGGSGGKHAPSAGQHPAVPADRR